MNEDLTVLTLTLYGEPRTKKNSQRILRAGARRFIAPSEIYERYRDDCIRQIPGPMRACVSEPVNVRCVYYMPTRRRVDLNNLLEATTDILVDAGVLKDDCSSIVAGHDGSRVRRDRARPRAEITISRMEAQEA